MLWKVPLSYLRCLTDTDLYLHRKSLFSVALAHTGRVQIALSVQLVTSALQMLLVASLVQQKFHVHQASTPIMNMPLIVI